MDEEYIKLKVVLDELDECIEELTFTPDWKAIQVLRYLKKKMPKLVEKISSTSNPSFILNRFPVTFMSLTLSRP